MADPKTTQTTGKAFVEWEGIPAVIAYSNIDTDVIIPIDKALVNPRGELGQWALYPLRYDSNGEKKLDFVLNNPQYEDASILIAGKNFGCGSSREVAAVALREYGWRVIISPSYGDIFRSNCIKNQILPVTLAETEWDSLVKAVQRREGELPARLRVSLKDCIITDVETGHVQTFEIDQASREQLLEGTDEMEKTLTQANEIRNYQCDDFRARKWIWSPLERGGPDRLVRKSEQQGSSLH